MQGSCGQGSFSDGWFTVRESFLDEVKDRVDWDKLERCLSGIYGSATGRPSYPLSVLLRSVLLQQWYGLSDPEAEAQIADRLSFRRFVGLSLQDAVPDHSTLCRFRHRLGERYPELFAAVASQLEAQGLMLKRGTLIDATLIKAASDKAAVDPEAKTGCGSRGYVHGYKAHVAVDQGSELIRQVIVTPAQVAETEVADALVQGDEAAVYADAAYSTHARRRQLRKRGINPAIVYRWHKNDTPRCPVMKAYNTMVSKPRSRVEAVFATLKERMRWRRCRYRGLHKNAVHIHLLAIAYNLKTMLRTPRHAM